MITIRFAGWISSRIVSLQPDTDIQKLLSIHTGTGYGPRYPKRFYRYFEDLDFWTKLHIAQSYICYLQKHIFSFLCHDSESVLEVAGVIFSDSDSAPVPNIFNPGPAILQIWESGSCSDSGCNHRSNRNFSMFYLRNDRTDSRNCRNGKVTPVPGSVFHKFWSGSERKTQNPAGVDSGAPDPVPSGLSVV